MWGVLQLFNSNLVQNASHNHQTSVFCTHTHQDLVNHHECYWAPLSQRRKADANLDTARTAEKALAIGGGSPGDGPNLEFKNGERDVWLGYVPSTHSMHSTQVGSFLSFFREQGPCSYPPPLCVTDNQLHYVSQTVN